MTLGDTVRLKSGGPVMTIVATHKDHDWSCTRFWRCKWFEGTVIRSEAFPAAALVAAKPE